MKTWYCAALVISDPDTSLIMPFAVRAASFDEAKGEAASVLAAVRKDRPGGELYHVAVSDSPDEGGIIRDPGAVEVRTGETAVYPRCKW